MKLRTYFRSTAAYRVRIALHIKDVEHDLVPVNLLSSEHQQDAFLKHNPEGLVPTLEVDDHTLTQSIAILEYLEEEFPQPALLPSTSLDRAYVRSLVQIIASDVHPINNLRVLKFLVNDLGVSEQNKMVWYHHWIAKAFTSLEQKLADSAHTGLFCFGDTPTFADVCLIPQVYNAKRFDCPMADYPTIRRIEQHCLTLPAFANASPEKQLDAL